MEDYALIVMTILVINLILLGYLCIIFKSQWLSERLKFFTSHEKNKQKRVCRRHRKDHSSLSIPVPSATQRKRLRPTNEPPPTVSPISLMKEYATEKRPVKEKGNSLLGFKRRATKTKEIESPVQSVNQNDLMSHSVKQTKDAAELERGGKKKNRSSSSTKQRILNDHEQTKSATRLERGGKKNNITSSSPKQKILHDHERHDDPKSDEVVLYHLVFVKRPTGISDPRRHIFTVLIHSADRSTCEEANRTLPSTSDVISDKQIIHIRPPCTFNASLECDGMTSDPPSISYEIQNPGDVILKTFPISIKKEPEDRPIHPLEHVTIKYSIQSAQQNEPVTRMDFQWSLPETDQYFSRQGSSTSSGYHLTGDYGINHQIVHNYHYKMIPMRNEETQNLRHTNSEPSLYENPQHTMGSREQSLPSVSSSMPSFNPFDPAIANNAACLPNGLMHTHISLGSGDQSVNNTKDMSQQANGAEKKVTQDIQKATTKKKKGHVMNRKLSSSERTDQNNSANITVKQEGKTHVPHVEHHYTEPQTIDQARTTDHSSKWEIAANKEYDSLKKSNAWELVKLPSGCKAMPCRWVFKLMNTVKPHRFRARLVAMGKNMDGKHGRPSAHGVDYGATFSRIEKFTSLRTVLAVAAEKGMAVHHLDIDTAFLFGNEDEEVYYMDQPNGYIKPGEERLVCKMKKSIFGSKIKTTYQNIVFHQELLGLGFEPSRDEPAIYSRNASGLLFIIAVFIDDMILAAESKAELQEFKEDFAPKFSMKDMGKLDYCLGVSVQQDTEKKCIRLHQKHYIQEMLDIYGQTGANKCDTPLSPKVKLQHKDGSGKVDSGVYQSMVKSLSHVAQATRPDIAFAVHALSKFNQDPTKTHLAAIKHVMQYLNATVDLKLTYKKSGKSLVAYSDANWERTENRGRSMTGNVFMLASGAVYWISKRQTAVALSSDHAEYMALCSATEEIVPLRRLLFDLQLPEKEGSLIMVDNQSAILLAEERVPDDRHKGIDFRFHYVREQLKKKEIKVIHCSGKDMVADPLTKQLPKPQFANLRTQMGLVPDLTEN